MNRRFFQESGRLGGRMRARKLTPERRAEIAAHAARARWKSPSPSWKSVRFQTADLTHPAYLEEILLEGSLRAWREIYSEISDRPFGDTARVLERVLSSSNHYGVTPLWTGLLRNAQKVFP